MNPLIKISIALFAVASYAGTLSVNPSTKYQTIEGIGGALAMYQGWIPGHPYKKEIYDTIFNGAGISILRMGNWLQDTTADMAGDSEIVAEFKKRTPNGKILVSSWSPPDGLKGNNNSNGTISPNSLKKVNGKFVYDQFGHWWASCIRRYNALGINPDYITIQNEINWNTDYWSALFNPTENDTIAAYAPAMEAVYDSIQSISPHPKVLGPEVLGTGYNAVESYAPTMNTSKFDGWAFHFYGSGDFNDPPTFLANNTASFSSLYNTTKSKPRFMTEYCNLGATDDTSSVQTIPDTSSSWFNLAWIMQEAFTALNLNAWVFWDLAWATPGSMIGIYPSWTQSTWPQNHPHGFIVRRTLPALGQYARFIKSGWIRVDANAADADLKVSAFTSSNDDSISIVIVNTSYSAITFTPSIANITSASGDVWTTSSTKSLEKGGTWTSGENLTIAPRTITTLNGKIGNAPPIEQTAYSNAEIPGTIQLENYDKGGANVAYYDTDAGNSGNQYRQDGVDIDIVETGVYALGWLIANEWTEYTISIQSSGTQSFQARVASGMDGGSFHLELDGVAITTTQTVPNTGAWSTYQIISGTTENLTAGTHVLRFVVDGSYFNIDWINFGEGPVSIRKTNDNLGASLESYRVYDMNGKFKGEITSKSHSEMYRKISNLYGPGMYLYRKIGETKTHQVEISEPKTSR
jgi:glucuronoarabinoxylan endo-1,4-beta-xylanase